MGIRFVTAHTENWCAKVWLWSYLWETEPVLRPSSHTQQPCSENIHREFLETCLAIQIPVHINHRINSPMDYHLWISKYHIRILITILKIRNWRYSQVKKLAQSHTENSKIGKSSQAAVLHKSYSSVWKPTDESIKWKKRKKKSGILNVFYLPIFL